MKKKYKRVYSISLEPGYRNYTVKDLIDLKGKKKLTQIHVATPEEARAAEEADIDILLVRVCPELKDSRLWREPLSIVKFHFVQLLFLILVLPI